MFPERGGDEGEASLVLAQQAGLRLEVTEERGTADVGCFVDVLDCDYEF